MKCLFCGGDIGKELPVPVKIVEFTPVVPYLPGVTPNKLGSTILTDRLSCQKCYGDIKKNDQEIIEEAGQIPNAK